MADAKMEWVRRSSSVPALCLLGAIAVAVLVPHWWREQAPPVILEAEQPGPARSRVVSHPKQPGTVSAGLRLHVLEQQIDALRGQFLVARGRLSPGPAAARRYDELQSDLAQLEQDLAAAEQALSVSESGEPRKIAFGSAEDRRLLKLHRRTGELFTKLHQMFGPTRPQPEARGGWSPVGGLTMHGGGVRR